MCKWTKVLAIILGVVILASIAVASGIALAADPQPTSPATTTPATSHRDIFISKLAAKLNVTVDQLKSAFTQARTDTLNQEVANGTITSAQRDWIQNRIQQAQQNGYGPGFGAGFGPRTRGPFNGTAPFNGSLPFNGTPPFGGTPPWSQTSPAPTK